MTESTPNSLDGPTPPAGSSRAACITLSAPAKINLNLLVGPRREDGYHPLDSLVVRVDLCDELAFAARDDGRIELRCDGADCGPPQRNLVVRAAEELRRAVGRGDVGVEITLAKRIPVGAGLGGGSSDAATALVGLRDLWRLSVSDGRLAELGAALGSDVPLFLAPPAVRMTGRGECVSPVAVHAFRVVLLLSGLHVSTAAVYGAFDSAPEPMGEQLDLRRVAEQPPSAWRSSLVNQLAGPARRVCPALSELWDRLSAASPVPIHLTGSGSALFALCDDEREARVVVASLPADVQAMARIVSPCAG